MIIIMLAATMTLAMLIATAFGLHQEAQRVRVESRQQKINRSSGTDPYSVCSSPSPAFPAASAAV